MSSKFIRGLFRCAGIRTDVTVLADLLPTFARGQFVILQGKGKDVVVFCGFTTRVFLLPNQKRTLNIEHGEVFRFKPGDANTLESWVKEDTHDQEIQFEFDWFRLPKKVTGQRPVTKIKFGSEKRNEKCWFCPSSDPADLELFRAMILKIAAEETARRANVGDNSLANKARQYREKVFRREG